MFLQKIDPWRYTVSLTLPFIFLGQEASFVGILTWDPSLIWNTELYKERVKSKAWFSLGHKHKHKDRRRRRKPEFSIPAHLDVKQDGGRHGWLPCAYVYAYVAPILISKKCDISISIRRTEAFVFLMLVLMLMSQVFSLALVALMLLLLLMLMS